MRRLTQRGGGGYQRKARHSDSRPARVAPRCSCQRTTGSYSACGRRFRAGGDLVSPHHAPARECRVRDLPSLATAWVATRCLQALRRYRRRRSRVSAQCRGRNGSRREYLPDRSPNATLWPDRGLNYGIAEGWELVLQRRDAAPFMPRPPGRAWSATGPFCFLRPNIARKAVEGPAGPEHRDGSSVPAASIK